MDQKYIDQIKKIRETMAPFKARVKRPAQGALTYDYLVPAGYYEEQWDWDAFFMGMALSSEISSEAIYLRNWALNYLLNANQEGYSPACVTPQGPETGHRAMLMKPFLAQGVYFSSRFLGDFSWVTKHYDRLKLVVSYRENNVWDKERDLGMWTNSMESGADNNVAALDYPDKTVVATDVNTYLYREFLAMSLVAKELGFEDDSTFYKNRAETVKNNIDKYLWNEEDKTYYNLDARTGEHIKRLSFNCVHPLWGQIASQEKADAFIKQYMLNPNKLWTDHGLRTLSKDDPQYSNENMIKPHSNWQGPVWPIANYIYMHALLNYGFQKEAIQLAQNIFSTVENDIKQTGGMHENYDAETGKSLAAPNFVSWNLLVGNMLPEAVEKRNPFKLG